MKWVVLVLVALAGFFVCDYVFGFTGMGNTVQSNGEQPEIEFELPEMDIIEETEVEVVEVVVVDPNPEPVNPNPTIPAAAEVDTTNQNDTSEIDNDAGVDTTDVETGTQA